MADNDPGKTATGAFGRPPAGAPQEIADNSPGAIQPTAEQLARARANERELQPLVFGAAKPPVVLVVPPTPAAQPTVQPAPAPVQPSAAPTPARPVHRVSRLAAVAIPLPATAVQPTQESENVTDRNSPHRDSADGAGELSGLGDSRVAAGSSPSSADPSPLAAAVQALHANRDANRPPVLTEADLLAVGNPDLAPRRPAESSTDSPSRGVPRPSADPGKQITGGFGDLGEAQYFPLDGTELRLLVDAQLESLRKRIIDDLRFSIAVTYPRVTARVVIEISAHMRDQSFEIVKVMPPHTKTPMEIARQHADECCFVMMESRVEMTEDGESVTPPNATRKELGLEIPFKRAIQAGGSRIMVDRES